jgi:hypothetical protein
VCKAARNAAYRAAQKPKGIRWISAMTPVQLAEAKAALERAMAQYEAKVGRPRKVAA